MIAVSALLVAVQQQQLWGYASKAQASHKHEHLHAVSVWNIPGCLHDSSDASLVE